MQVILLEKVLNVGDLGEIVKVKPGFARNYLIPQGKAKRATPENLVLLEEKRAEFEKIAADKLTRAQEVAANLDGVAIQVTQKAGVDGRLFGSVTAQDIATAIREARGLKIDKRNVHMPEPIKNVGTYMVVVEVVDDVTATIKTMVVAKK